MTGHVKLHITIKGTAMSSNDTQAELDMCYWAAGSRLTHPGVMPRPLKQGRPHGDGHQSQSLSDPQPKPQ